MTTEEIKKCVIVGKVMTFLDEHPDGAETLELIMSTNKLLWTTADVASLTGWSAAHVLRLCSQGVLPYIPGNPHMFMIKPLMVALEQLQTGGIYGRKSRMKKRRAAA